METTTNTNINTKEYWDKESKNNSRYDYPNSDICYEISKNIEYGNSVLDVGSGTGRVIGDLKKFRPNLNISACDFSETSVGILKNLKLNNVFLADITKGVPVDSKSYDVVMACEVIEHLENVEQAILELVRIARKKIIITVPYKEKIISPEHLWLFSLDDVYNLLKPFGMVDLTVANGNTNIVAVCKIK